MFSRVCTVALAVGLVWVAGCGPATLDITKTKTLDPRGDSDLILDLSPQPVEQKLTVTVDSKTDKVDVYVLLAKDFEKYDQAAPAFSKRAEAATASKNAVMSDTVTATIPANTQAKVIVALANEATKSTEVTVKLSNKK